MITLTSIAESKIKTLLTKTGYSGIRIGVRTTGCSGLAYVLEYIDKDSFDPSDELISYPDFFIKVYKKDTVYLTGLEINYARQGLNEGFEFNNPNERDRCGCGESFRI